MLLLPSLALVAVTDLLIARLHDSDWTDEKQVELDAWLAESVAHEVAYLRLEAGWDGADRLSVLRLSPQAPLRPKPRIESSRKVHIAAALLVCAGIGAAFYATGNKSQDQVFVTLVVTPATRATVPRPPMGP